MSMNFKKIFNIINPQPVLAGLEINNSELRFMKIRGDDSTSASLKLPPGVMEAGKIKDKRNFTESLLNLHSQITGRKKKKIYVIVSIPNVNVYAKVFNLPTTASANLEEAANLNLQMISPIDFAETYSDWQTVGENKNDGNQMEILGALAPKSIIDEFIGCLEEANFGVAAIEFSALSLVRLAAGFGIGIDIKNQYLLLQVGGDGLNFSIMKNGNLYFAHFYPWKSDEKEKEQRQISFSDFKELVVEETRKVLNFYETHWEGKINKAILTSSGLVKETIKILSEDLSLEVQPLTLKKFNQLSPDWHGVLSLAFRGLIPRSQDTIISLASVGTEDNFKRYRIVNFISIWRNVVFVSLIFIVAVFGASVWFLSKTMKSINLSDTVLPKTTEINELSALQERAKSFNEKVETALKSKKTGANWSLFFEKINNSANSANVTLKRILIQSAEAPAIIDAIAVNQEAVINFKNFLIQQPQFMDVDLPLSKINVAVDGSAEFSVGFKIKIKN